MRSRRRRPHGAATTAESASSSSRTPTVRARTTSISEHSMLAASIEAVGLVVRRRRRRKTRLRPGGANLLTMTTILGCWAFILATGPRLVEAKDCDNRELRNLIQNVCTGVRMRRSSAAEQHRAMERGVEVVVVPDSRESDDLETDSSAIWHRSRLRRERQIMSIREIILSSSRVPIVYNRQYRPIPRSRGFADADDDDDDEGDAMALPPAAAVFYRRPDWSGETMAHQPPPPPSIAAADTNFDEIMELLTELYETVLLLPPRQSREIADQYKGVKVECCRASTDRCVEKIKGLCVNFN